VKKGIERPQKKNKKKKTTKSEKIDARKVKKKILALKIFSQSAKKSMSEESRKNGLKVVKKKTRGPQRGI
jgi:hypothetical protein